MWGKPTPAQRFMVARSSLFSLSFVLYARNIVVTHPHLENINNLRIQGPFRLLGNLSQPLMYPIWKSQCQCLYSVKIIPLYEKNVKSGQKKNHAGVRTIAITSVIVVSLCNINCRISTLCQNLRAATIECRDRSSLASATHLIGRPRQGGVNVRLL